MKTPEEIKRGMECCINLIIEMAGKFLAEKLSRTKAAKELLTAPGGKKEE